MSVWLPPATTQMSFFPLYDSRNSLRVISVGVSLSLSPLIKRIGQVTFFICSKLSHLTFSIVSFNGPKNFKKGKRTTAMSDMFVKLFSTIIPLKTCSCRFATKWRATALPRDLPIRKTRSMLTFGEAYMNYTIAFASSKSPASVGRPSLWP